MMRAIFQFSMLSIVSMLALSCTPKKTEKVALRIDAGLSAMAVGNYCVNVMGPGIAGWTDSFLESPFGYKGVTSAAYSASASVNEIELEVTQGKRYVQLISSSDGNCSFESTSQLQEIARGSVEVIANTQNQITLQFNDNPTADDVRKPFEPSSLEASPDTSSILLRGLCNSEMRVTSCELERSIDGTTYSQVGASLPVAETQFEYSDTTVTGGVVYYYRVKGINAWDQTASQPIMSSTTTGGGGGGFPTPPAAPSSLVFSNQTTSSIQIDWTDNSNNELGFRVERSPDGVNSWTLQGSPGAGVTSFTDTNSIGPSTLYYYRVSSYNSSGSSVSYATGSTSSAAGGGGGGGIPTAPSSLVAMPDTMNAPNVLLTWADNSNNETGFEIERSTSSGSGFAQIGTAAAGFTSYFDTSASPSTTYYYRVRAVNASGNSAYTSEASVVNP